MADMTVDMSGVDKLARELKKFSDRAAPFAIRSAINGYAFDARLNWQDEIDDKFITRNRFTRNSIRVETARGLNVDRMESVVGSIAPYMEKAEFGGTEAKKGKHGVAIATSVASGEGEGTRPRRKLVRKPNKMKNIRLSRSKKRGMSRGMQNLVAVQEAISEGKKYVYMKTRRSEGIFKITGNKNKAKFKMVWDLSRPTITIPSNPTMAPAVKSTIRIAPGIAKAAFQDQIRRQRLFQNR